MKLLLVSPHFFPENFKCNDLAFELAAKGHDVTVLSDIPNYPQGKYFKGYSLFRRRKEVVNGVTVYRAIVIPRGNATAVRLAFNYASFVLFASVIALYLAFFKKFDAVIVHETSPITVGIPACIVKKIQRIPMLFWVLDLWPESLSAAGGIENKQVIGFFTWLTKRIYHNSDKILISSKGFEQSIREKGPFADKIHYYPNWADRALGEKKEYTLPEMPEGFIVMFAGNIGEAQDFDHLMEAARLLKEETGIHFVLVGDGRKRPWVEDFIARHSLEKTVHWVGRHPLEAMPVFFARANAMIVSLKDQLIFNLTAPAKIQAYMSAGKPIVMMQNGEGPRIIREADCGYAVPAGDAAGFAELIRKMAQMPAEELERMGASGKAYCQEHFQLDKSIDQMCQWLDEVAGRK